jgi:predicted enzyme related to lactoylglutathione lyase
MQTGRILMGAPFVWFDLSVADGAKVAGFYQGLFGWETGPGAGGYQDWLLDGGQPWAGTVPAGAVPAGHWIPYVAVDNLAVAVSKAVGLGGTVIRDKVAGPAGNSVIVADPGGALIALFTPAAG